MRWASDCTSGRDSVPRGLDWISAESCSSLTFLLPSNATRPITGFSTTVTTSLPPAWLILTSWNSPVSISAFKPSSIRPWSSRPPGPGLKYERMVSASTRRLPSTAMEDAVWAATGDAINPAATVPATGIAAVIRGANKPPRTRIPTTMRKAPLLSLCRSAPLRPGRSPVVAPLVANSAKAANRLSLGNFIFIPRRCLSATRLEKPLTTQPDEGCRYRSQTPSASAQGQVRYETPSPGRVPRAAGPEPPRPHRTKGDRHPGVEPGTG